MQKIHTKYKMSQLSNSTTPNASISHSLTNTKTTKRAKNAQQVSKALPKKLKKQAKNAFFAPITEIFP
jgi:hypothetical protein